MTKYKIAPGKSLVAKRRVYGPGEEIGEDCFGDKNTIAALLKNGSIVKVSAKASGKDSKKAADEESGKAADEDSANADKDESAGEDGAKAE